MRIVLRYIIWWALLIIGIGTGYAQCPTVDFSIIGPTVVTIDQEASYEMVVKNFVSTGDIENMTGFIEQWQSSYMVRQGDIRHARTTTETLTYNFWLLGQHTINASFNNGQCDYKAEIKVQVYQSIIVYIGGFLTDFNFGIDENLNERDILLHTVIIDEETLNDREVFNQTINAHKEIIQYADYMFINLPSYAWWFTLVDALPTALHDTLSIKPHILLSNIDHELVKKYLAPFVRQSSIQSLYLLSTTDFIDILLAVSVGNIDESYNNMLKTPLTFDNRGFPYSIGYAIDYGLFHWFPLEIVQLLLALIFATTLVVFIKQVIGLNVFGVYYPILFALTMYTVGERLSLVLLSTALLTTFLVSRLFKYITLLVAAKTGIRIVLYIIISFISIAIAHIVGWIDGIRWITQPTTVLLAYFFIALIVNKIAGTYSSFFKAKRWGQLAWFGLLSSGLLRTISYAPLYNRLLRYPSTSLIFLTLTLLLGRFAGLQLVEYIRFFSLINHRKKHK